MPGDGQNVSKSAALALRQWAKVSGVQGIDISDGRLCPVVQIDESTWDCTDALTAIIVEMPSVASRLVFPWGTWVVTRPLPPITRRGLSLHGERDGRPTQGGGSRIRFSPSAALQNAGPCTLFQLGVSGVANDPEFNAAYATANYGGPQEFYVSDLSFEVANEGASDALTNGQNTYGHNCFAIRDFFSGDVRLRNVWFERFRYGFWGVQSDFSKFEQVYYLYCKYGRYSGPRSDQQISVGEQFLLCDNGLWLDRCANSKLVAPKFIGCGAGTTDTPLRLGTQYADDACHGHHIDTPWFECQQGASVEAFMELGGPADAQPTRDNIIQLPLVATNPQGTPPFATYLARIGDSSPRGNEFYGLTNGVNNLLKCFKFTSAANTQIRVFAHDDFSAKVRQPDNTGAGSPTVTMIRFGASHTLGSGTGRLIMDYTTQAANYANNWQIGSESSFRLLIAFPNIGNDTSFVDVTRRWVWRASLPGVNSYQVGDTIENQTPSVGAVTRWKNLATGLNFAPEGQFNGTSADRGDNSVTVTAGTDAPTQKFNTPLTANRTVTLSVTGVWNGAKFRVYRTANATGASTLTVLTKALAVGQWVDVEYDGAAWQETAFGSL